MIVARTIADPKKLMSVTSKVCGQLVAKLGGALWATPTVLKSTMVIGIDVVKNKGQEGVTGAMVASINDSFTQYFSKAFMCENEDDLSGNFMINAYGKLRLSSSLVHV